METGTIEQTLPGLEGMTPQPELELGRAIALNPQKRLMLFSGRSNPDLAQRIAEQLGIELGHVKLKTFANGETYCRFEESVRGADMFIVQSACDPVDRHLMELLIMINAARLASAKRITAVVPWYFYARQDKKSRPREPITARLVADMLQSAGADRVLTMDLHAGQVQGFFHIPVDHMTAIPLFAQYVRDLESRPADRRGVARHRPHEARGEVRRDDRRRPRRPEQGATGSPRRPRDHGDRRRRREDRDHDGRHRRHGRNARRRRRGAQGERARSRSTHVPRTVSSTARPSSASQAATSTGWS